MQLVDSIAKQFASLRFFTKLSFAFAVVLGLTILLGGFVLFNLAKVNHKSGDLVPWRRPAPANRDAVSRWWRRRCATWRSARPARQRKSRP